MYARQRFGTRQVEENPGSRGRVDVQKPRELSDTFRDVEIDPGPDVKTDAEIRAWIRANVTTDFHPCGTCRTGLGQNSVADERFRVHGIEGLRVVDASMKPRVISANLNAPTQMLAARAADFIAGHAQLAPRNPPFAFESA